MIPCNSKPSARAERFFFFFRIENASIRFSSFNFFLLSVFVLTSTKQVVSSFGGGTNSRDDSETKSDLKLKKESVFVPGTILIPSSTRHFYSDSNGDYHKSSTIGTTSSREETATSIDPNWTNEFFVNNKEIVTADDDVKSDATTSSKMNHTISRLISNTNQTYHSLTNTTTIMNMKRHVMFQKNSNDSYTVRNNNEFNGYIEDNHDSFCQTEGMYMTMFMDGFHTSLLSFTSNSIVRKQKAATILLSTSPDKIVPLGSTHSNTVSTNTTAAAVSSSNVNACLNYFVSSWKLDDRDKFQGAMIFAFLLAILIEALSAVRMVIVTQYSRTVKQKHTRHFLLTICYGVQGLLGYLLMLITMSYSIELVVSVIAGLMVGNILFMSYDPIVVHSTPTNASTRRNRTRTIRRTNPHTLVASCITDATEVASINYTTTTSSATLNKNNNHDIDSTTTRSPTTMVVTNNSSTNLYRRRTGGTGTVNRKVGQQSHGRIISATTNSIMTQHQLSTPRTPLTMLQTDQSIQNSAANSDDDDDENNIE